MRDIFKGFLVLRLAGLLTLLVIAALVLGIRALTRGSDIVGIAILAVALVFIVALGSLVAQRAKTRPH
jgi:hypothetical protein